MIDLRDMVWSDSKDIFRITELVPKNSTHIVWFINIDTSEERCMDVESFLEKFTSQGLFDDLESV